MPYYAYNAGNCGNCGKRIGLIETYGGRQRQYCNDSCKVAAHRKRHYDEKRNKCLLRNGELRDFWQEKNITGPLLLKLQNILVEHGKQAAKDATDAVLLAVYLTKYNRGISS